jgi:cytochrome b involved in lipid metabolism
MVPEKYFTSDEIELHNSPEDCWVSFNGLVFDLTSLVEKHRGSSLARPILQNAGRDISHWFENGQVRMHVHPETGCSTVFTPRGRFFDVPPHLPRSDWQPKNPWWEDMSLCIGHVTEKPRKIRIINMLTKDEHIVKVWSVD